MIIFLGEKKTNMKKIIGYLLSIAIAISVMIDGFIIFLKGGRQTQATQNSSSLTSNKSQCRSTSTQFKDGTYTGKSTKTKWGDVQVQATIKNGKISVINVLKYPDTNGHSKNINAKALPIYKSEALSAQSSKIQHISGATVTFGGFTGSLQDVLNKAKNTNNSNPSA